MSCHDSYLYDYDSWTTSFWHKLDIPISVTKNLHGSFHSKLLHFLCQALSCCTKNLATRGPANARYKRKHISMLVWQQILPGSLSVRWDYCALGVAKAATTNYNES